MDRDRLKNIQTADLSDSHLNEDFVHWLKTKGPSYVLIIMIVIVAYLFFVRYQQGKNQYRAEAWIAFLEARVSTLPASYEDVAQTYADVDSLGSLGLLSAADAYLRSVVIGQAIGSDSNNTTTLTLEDRSFYLEKSDDLYRRVVANDSNDETSTLFAISGYFGRAAVAEASGEIDSARGFLEKVITRSGTQYPALGQQAQLRIDSLSPLTQAIILPTDAEIEAWNNQTSQRESVLPNEAIDAITDLSDSISE